MTHLNENPEDHELLHSVPREDGTRRGLPVLGILLVLGLGLVAFACGSVNFMLLYPSNEGWIWFGGGVVIALICGLIAVLIFRRTSPDRPRKK